MAYNYDHLNVGDELSFIDGSDIHPTLLGRVVDKDPTRGVKVAWQGFLGDEGYWFSNSYHSKYSHWVLKQPANPLEVM